MFDRGLSILIKIHVEEELGYSQQGYVHVFFQHLSFINEKSKVDHFQFKCFNPCYLWWILRRILILVYGYIVCVIHCYIRFISDAFVPETEHGTVNRGMYMYFEYSRFIIIRGIPIFIDIKKLN
jgi:hypothetical protein